METIGDAYNRSYNSEMNQANKYDRLLIDSQRVSNQADFQKARLQNMNLMSQMKLLMMQKQLAAMKQSQALKIAQLQQSQNDYNEKVREFNINEQDKLNAAKNGGSVQDYREDKLKMGGLPFTKKTSNGDLGLYRMPTGAEATSLQKVIDAYPQLYTAIDEISQGADYIKSNLPGETKKYSSAIISYLAGKATPGQEKIIEESGVSLDALIQASETAQRVMNIPKTNEGMKRAFDLFLPRTGDTIDSYNNRLANIKNNFTDRYWQAQYQLQGIPLKASNGEVPNAGAALIDMQNFVVNSRGDTSPLQNLEVSQVDNVANSKNSSLQDGVTESDIDAAMQVNPSATKEQIIAALVKARNK
jgi:hypothetical protein